MIHFFLFTQPALSDLSCSCLVSGLDGKMDCTSVRSYTRGVWQTFYLCLWPRSNGQPSCCVQGHRVLPLDKPSAHLGDLFYNQLPGWPMALYTTSALCDTVLFVLAWCRPRTEQPASRAMSILCTFNLFRAFPHPSGMRLHQTLYRLYRVTSISVELCATTTTTKGHIFTELYCPTAPVSGHSDHRRQDEGCCHPNSHKSEF